MILLTRTYVYVKLYDEKKYKYLLELIHIVNIKPHNILHLFIKNQL